MNKHKEDITVGGFTAFRNGNEEWVFPGRRVVKMYSDALDLATKYARLLAKVSA